MSPILQAVIAVIVAIPKLKELWDQAIAFYVKEQLERMKEADREAIRKAIYEHDQRQLEKQLFGKDKSEVSGHAGSELRDGLPNVVSPKEG